ncbi:hypothetical protein ASD50_15105 [Mesorhizobium sp. Root552]|jgi:hypothetical protein|uniref:hypothetical protein n=1 Tax=Mesorhizobium sp. Root552 TaxID=1736555 RepID=UPI0006F38F58|nr:hypothetical protein [Mesorhizobium sp. Root552]KQZ31593.1 hypothetical protein ASD50_15105 [Mesorhizobium sp. Root552]
MTEPKNDLHRLRLAIMTTQATMAAHMGVPLRTYEDLETGKSTLRPIHLNAARWACVSIQSAGLAGRATLPDDVFGPIIEAGFEWRLAEWGP